MAEAGVGAGPKLKSSLKLAALGAGSGVSLRDAMSPKPNGSARPAAGSSFEAGVATGSRLNGSSKAGELRWLE
ncbi:hypothetical protein EN852_038220, partial [Mesorhizobium sp. M2E.F.Ca.ET.209.01.1.1]|uniref:hypothetical protein n=1 Tax=Mesorhizobium sp. M2E.F.Ca.ET.209.01.1.1 TaxID=2500526 RepID=UPI001091DF59